MVKLNKLQQVIALCTAFFLFAGCAAEYSLPSDDIPETEYIVHAAGELWGTDSGGVYRSFLGSNSLEGLEQCADAGQWTVELDFNFTSDGFLACIHDWMPEYIDGIAEWIPLPLEEFLASEIYWNFTPVSLAQVADFLREHEEMLIVTDIKDRFDEAAALIAETCPDLLNRFVIQIYQPEQYDTVRALGFEQIIYTLYQLDWEDKTDWRALGKFAKRHPLVGFTFSYELCEVPGFVDGMLKSGVPLYVHTVNGKEEQQKYFDMGITGVYTDDVVNNLKK